MDIDPPAVNQVDFPFFKKLRGWGVGVVSTSPDVADFSAFPGASPARLFSQPIATPAARVRLIGVVNLPFVNQTTPPRHRSDHARHIHPRTAEWRAPPRSDLVATPADSLI